MKIDYVIARYNEKMDWLFCENVYNRMVCNPDSKIIVYNKGINDVFFKTENMKIVELPNYGKNDHTYLLHIVANYDNLSDLTVFLTGSVYMPHKWGMFEPFLDKICDLKKEKTIFLFYSNEEIKTYRYDFNQLEYLHTCKENQEINTITYTDLAKVRPFGKWFEYIFGEELQIHHYSHNGIFAVAKKHILQKPKSYYERLLEEFGTDVNPEVGHFFERSWCAVFHPYGEDEIDYLKNVTVF